MLVYSAPVPGFWRGRLKFAAFGSSVSFQPKAQWLVMLRRWLLKLWNA